MVKEIIWRKKAIARFQKIVDYLQSEWSAKVAEEFIEEVEQLETILLSHPYSGSESKERNYRKLVLTKHNTVIYKVKGNKVFILSINDNRSKNIF